MSEPLPEVSRSPNQKPKKKKTGNTHKQTPQLTCRSSANFVSAGQKLNENIFVSVKQVARQTPSRQLNK